MTGKISTCPVPGGTFPAMKPGTVQNIAFAAASVQSAAIGSPLVRVAATADCHIAIGTNPTASANSMFLPAKAPEYLVCNPTDKIAVIQDTAGGNLSVVAGA